MTLARIRKGDEVIVLAGREKGKRGIVRQVLPTAGRALVQDLNIAKRRYKAGAARQAGTVEIELPIHLSNLAPIDQKTKKATRVRARVLKSGKKVRIAAGSGELIDKE